MAFDDKTEDFTPGTHPAADNVLSAEYADSIPKNAGLPIGEPASSPVVALLARDNTEPDQLFIPATIAAVSVGDPQVAEKGDRVQPGPAGGKGPRLRPADGAETNVPWPQPGDTNVTVVPKTLCEATPAHAEYQRYLTKANDYFITPGVLNIEELKSRYTCAIKTSADAAAFAKAEIATIGDRFTHLDLPGEVKSRFEPTLGINAGFKFEPGLLANGMLVSEVPPGSPAANAGLLVGDRVTSINGRSIKGLEYDAAIAQLNGPKSVSAILEVTRNGRPYNLLVDRSEVDRTLTERMLNDTTAYLRVANFSNANLSNQIFQAVQKDKAAQMIVLDLRNNPGGLVTEALEVASMFVKGDGVLLRTRERIAGTDTYKEIEHVLRGKNLISIETDPGQKPRIASTVLRQPYIGDGKQIVVLTDHGTASAAEIVSGALQDNKAATVVGAPTYGKGIGQVWIQKLENMADLYVTNFMYKTPNGRWPGDGSGAKGSGLQPDVLVENPPSAILGTSADTQLLLATMVLPPTPVRRAK